MDSGPLALGRTLGDYELLDVLGAGGMGVAYKAFDRRLKRTVALKTLKSAITQLPDLKRQLLREARAAAALSHPNICTIHTIGEDDGVPYIVMEYVRGQTLATLAGAGPLDPMQASALATQVADALATAHEHNIVHRDIKPANVMVSDDGQVKVLDFGIAVPTVATPEEAMTQTSVGLSESLGSAMGTVAYMSPEQLSGEKVDGRSDIFSLGVVLYELCAGHHPFSGASTVATISRILSAPVPPIASIVPGFPEQLDSIIQRCLAKDREARFASARELLAQLSRGESRVLWRRRDVTALPSIAVLPFVNLSGDPHEDYVAEGITTELTSRLAQAGDLLVISRTSTMRFRHTSRDAREIGRDLGVRALVEGAVRVRGQVVQLSVNLIDVHDGFHLWASTIEAPADGIFDVAAGIVDQLATVLRKGAPGRAPTSPAVRANRTAHEKYLRAVHAYHKFTSADNLVAIELLQHAIATDPFHARAHALLANAFLARVERGWEVDVVRWLGAATTASAESLRLDAGVSEAYSARGLIHFFRGNREEAEADAREALRADGNNDIAHDLLGRVRFARGEFRGAVAAYRDALTINPYYVWCLNDLAWSLMVMGEEDEAERTLERVLSISPADEGGLCGKAALHHMRGERSEALAVIVKARDQNPRYPWVALLLPIALARCGQVEAATAACEAMIEQPASAFFGYASLGLVALEAGDEAKARRCVDKALAITPFYPALNLGYANLYDHAGATDIAEEWVGKAVRDGIRLVEAHEWHPTLRRLADRAGLIHARNESNDHATHTRPLPASGEGDWGQR